MMPYEDAAEAMRTAAGAYSATVREAELFLASYDAAMADPEQDHAAVARQDAMPLAESLRSVLAALSSPPADDVREAMLGAVSDVLDDVFSDAVTERIAADILTRLSATHEVRPYGTVTDAEVVTLCGCTKFKDAFMSENARLTMEGRLVISLGLFGHTDLPDYDWTTDASDLKRMLDRLHFQKIDLADRVHVVNVGGYYGESTAREIAYARSLGKPVTFMEPVDADGEARS